MSVSATFLNYVNYIMILINLFVVICKYTYLICNRFFFLLFFIFGCSFVF